MCLFGSVSNFIVRNNSGIKKILESYDYVSSIILLFFRIKETMIGIALLVTNQVKFWNAMSVGEFTTLTVRQRTMMGRRLFVQYARYVTIVI